MGRHDNDRLQGTLDLLVLKVLASRGRMHGYGITLQIQQISREELRVEEGSLYPALHRIEQSVVEQEIEAAGFVLVESADFLKNPDDTRDWSASPRVAGEKRGHSDRFVLKFVKPNKSQR